MLSNSSHENVYQILFPPTVGKIFQMHVLTVDYTFIWVREDQIEMKTYFTRQHLNIGEHILL